MPIILFFSLILPLLLYSGTLDPFAPQHIVPIIDINQFGYGSENLIEKTPAFYIFGSVLSLITGISPENLLFIPIQLIPLVLITFILFRKISGSSLIASLIVIILATIDVSGNKFFFWVHGMGNILFFLIIFLLIKQLDQNKAQNIILIFISITGLIYTSYDLTFSIISLLISILLIMILNRKIFSQNAYVNSRQISQFTNIILFLLVIQFALSEFVYKTLIPQFQGSAGAYSLDNFVFSYFQGSTSTLAISITYPPIISLLGILKYIVISVFVIMALYYILLKIKNSKTLGGNINIMFISFVIAISTYIIAKFIMGQFAIGTFFIVGLFGIAVVYKNYNNKKIKEFTVLALIFILLINLAIFNTYNDNGFINKDDENYNYIEYSADWLYEYSNYTISSDVLTRNFYYLYAAKNNFNSQKSNYDTIRVLNPERDIYNIVQIPTSKKIKKDGYYILNYDLNMLELTGWKTVKPWHEYKQEIDNNTEFNEIYNSKYISILC